ncbi:MAG: tyrosine-type recombinase/integrase [Hyphomicrobium sp.]
MPKTIHRLTAVRVQSLKDVGLHPDGAGLYLKVQESGAKSWVFRYMLDRRPRYLGLGSANTVSLAAARALTTEARQLLEQGVDPIDFRKQAKANAVLAETRLMTFRECAEAYMASHEPGWKNDKHRKQWRSTLKRHVYSVFGDVPASAVTTEHVLEVLQPIWHATPETASRVRGRIEVVLDWAKTRGAREGDNPARWRGHLANLLPKPSKIARVVHHAALPFTQMPAFMSALREAQGLTPRALEFVILTAARTSEALGARWSEFDLDKKIWTVPAERMKAGKEHRVPLSARALEVLQELKEVRRGEFVFPGLKPGRPLSNMALLMLLRRLNRAEITVHGFRSTFRDWAAECTAVAGEVAEMALAHSVSSAVEAAYRRGNMLEKRRELMAAWARYCEGGDAAVVHFRARGIS